MMELDPPSTNQLKRPVSPVLAGTDGNFKCDANDISVQAKKAKLDTAENPDASSVLNIVDEQNGKENTHRKGSAPVKKEYLIFNIAPNAAAAITVTQPDDDEAEAKPQSTYVDERDKRGRMTKEEKKNRKGQNKNRRFAKLNEDRPLCKTRAKEPEFSPKECQFGDRCKDEHDLRKYMAARENFMDGPCPVWETRGWCHTGWRCKWVRSHMEEVPLAENEGSGTLPQNEGVGNKVDRKELRLTVNEDKRRAAIARDGGEGVLNDLPMDEKIKLFKKKYIFEKAEPFLEWLEKVKPEENTKQKKEDEVHDEDIEDFLDTKRDSNASYIECPFKPSEKRLLHISASTPLLAPLTTTGNLPFRRLCTSFGASITYSEMAVAVPLVQGQKGEWALVRSHPSEKNFGAQISANKPWNALKATECLARGCPDLKLIDLNAGCPIDLIYKSGGGSGLLPHTARMAKMLKGMNYVSNNIPITVKLRMGCADNHPVAKKLIRRLIAEGDVAAITLHGRSRQQRYTRAADWTYIAQCSTMIQTLKQEKKFALDTSIDNKDRDESRRLVPYFVGNGDCYSHIDYYRALETEGIDSVMVARGALIKPWIFEEIHAGQYLDKSATERLGYIEQYTRYGLDYWGSDEWGVNQTRRFLCEFLSFTYRHIPYEILEYLPPNIQDRPPKWKGRNDLETLLGSPDYKDWIRISEMFLGKSNPDFQFVPKHKSNSYEAIEAEG